MGRGAEGEERRGEESPGRVDKDRRGLGGKEEAGRIACSPYGHDRRTCIHMSVEDEIPRTEGQPDPEI